MPDVDGDGVPEVFAFAYPSDPSGAMSDNVFESSLFAGGGSFGEADASRRYVGTEAEYPQYNLAAGDLNGDGDPELMIEERIAGSGGGAFIFSW